MKKYRIVYRPKILMPAFLSLVRHDRVEIPESWPSVTYCPNGLQYEVQTRCLFADAQHRLVAQETTDKMMDLWQRQFQLAVHVQDTDPVLFRRVYKSPLAAIIRLYCPPAVVKLQDAKRFYQHCERTGGQCPFCWARRVQAMFEHACRVLFGQVPRHRDDQVKLKNRDIVLYEEHEPLMVKPDEQGYPLPERKGIDWRTGFARAARKQDFGIWGMSTLVTVEYCTPGGCKVWVRRMALMSKPFKNTPNKPEMICSTHKPPLTMQKLAEVMGRVFAYPYRDQPIEDMMPVLERFALMREHKNHLRLLSSSGVMQPHKASLLTVLRNKEPGHKDHVAPTEYTGKPASKDPEDRYAGLYEAGDK